MSEVRTTYRNITSGHSILSYESKLYRIILWRANTGFFSMGADLWYGGGHGYMPPPPFHLYVSDFMPLDWIISCFGGCNCKYFPSGKTALNNIVCSGTMLAKEVPYLSMQKHYVIEICFREKKLFNEKLNLFWVIG